MSSPRKNPKPAPKPNTMISTRFVLRPGHGSTDELPVQFLYCVGDAGDGVQIGLRRGAKLMCLRSMSPEQARELASALLAAANDCGRKCRADSSESVFVYETRLGDVKAAS